MDGTVKGHIPQPVEQIFVPYEYGIKDSRYPRQYNQKRNNSVHCLPDAVVLQKVLFELIQSFHFFSVVIHFIYKEIQVEYDHNADGTRCR